MWRGPLLSRLRGYAPPGSAGRPRDPADGDHVAMIDGAVSSAVMAPKGRGRSERSGARVRRRQTGWPAAAHGVQVRCAESRSRRQAPPQSAARSMPPTRSNVRSRQSATTSTASGKRSAVTKHRRSVGNSLAAMGALPCPSSGSAQERECQVNPMGQGKIGLSGSFQEHGGWSRSGGGCPRLGGAGD